MGTIGDARAAIQQVERLALLPDDPETGGTFAEVYEAATALGRQIRMDYPSVEQAFREDLPLTPQAQALLEELLAKMDEAGLVPPVVSFLSGACVVIVGDIGTLPDMKELALALQGLAAGVEIRAHVPLSSIGDRTS